MQELVCNTGQEEDDYLRAKMSFKEVFKERREPRLTRGKSWGQLTTGQKVGAACLVAVVIVVAVVTQRSPGERQFQARVKTCEGYVSEIATLSASIEDHASDRLEYAQETMVELEQTVYFATRDCQDVHDAEYLDSLPELVRQAQTQIRNAGG